MNLSLDWTYVLDKALDNLHKCLWIGILERYDESVELLNYQTGLKIKKNHDHKGPPQPKPTDSDIKALTKLMPLDLYIYEYAKQLFDHRWRIYLKETNSTVYNFTMKQSPDVELKLPKFIEDCTSTKKYIHCPDNL